MPSISFKYIIGCLVGMAAIVIAGLILLSTNSVAGLGVPDDVTTLAASAETAGATYVPITTALDGDCVAEANVTDDQRDQVMLVTGSEAQPCTFDTDAWRGDAVWGALFLLLVVAALLGVWHLSNRHASVTVLVLAALIVAGVLLGAFLDDPFRKWLADMGVIMVVFWKGFFAAAAVVAGLYGAHELQRRNTP